MSSPTTASTRSPDVNADVGIRSATTARRPSNSPGASTTNAMSHPSRGPITFGEFLTNTWIPHKRRQLRATTAYRYAWFVERYIQPALGEVPLRRLRADHLDLLYDTLGSAAAATALGSRPRPCSRCTP
jgi:hypothetical protein